MAQQGLFGMYDPNAILQQRNEQLGKEAYMASQGGGAYAPLLNAAYRLGDVAGAGIGKLFGLEDPVLKKAALADEATKAVQAMDINMSDPKQLYPALIKQLQVRGLSDMALPLVKQYQDALSAESRMKYEEALSKKAADGYEYKQDQWGNVTVLKDGAVVKQVPGMIFGGATPSPSNAPALPGAPTNKPAITAVPDTDPYMFDDKGRIVPNPKYKPK